MNHPARHFYEFGRFRVDPNERLLLQDGQPLPLPPKVFDTLLVLVQNSRHLLTKEELMNKVWADTFVEDNNLIQYVSALRRALNGEGDQFIETVPRRGYRFAAKVREIWEEDEAVIVEHRTRQSLHIEETVEREAATTRQAIFYRVIASSRPRLALAAGVLVLIAGGVSAWVWNRAEKSDARALPLMIGTKNEEAFELYQKGRALWQTRSSGDLHQATMLLEQSVERDPNFALAHSALADAYAFDYRFWNKAEAQARAAIRLDPNLGEPRATIGFVKMFWEWKLKEAEEEFKQAVRLSPNYATGHQWYGLNLLAIGQAGSAALVEMKQALDLEPASLSINADLCQTLYFLRRYDEAIAQCQKTLAADAGFINGHFHLYEIYNAKGKHAEAVEMYFKIEQLHPQPSPPDRQEKIREAYRTGGIRAFWEARIKYLPYGVPNHYRIAQHHARLGNQTETFRHLQKAYETRDFNFVLFLADPVFEDFRLHTSYMEVMKLLFPPEA
ncbi:MAG: winged helix-turn-helix domain-containing protein [Acidobacteriota bacterium]